MNFFYFASKKKLQNVYCKRSVVFIFFGEFIGRDEHENFSEQCFSSRAVGDFDFSIK